MHCSHSIVSIYTYETPRPNRRSLARSRVVYNSIHREKVPYLQLPFCADHGRLQFRFGLRPLTIVRKYNNIGDLENGPNINWKIRRREKKIAVKVEHDETVVLDIFVPSLHHSREIKQRSVNLGNTSRSVLQRRRRLLDERHFHVLTIQTRSIMYAALI